MSTFQAQCSMDVDHDDSSSVHHQHVIDLTRSRSAPPAGQYQTHSIPVPSVPRPPQAAKVVAPLLPAATTGATAPSAVVMTVEKRYEQMKSETLPMEYRRERLCRLVYTSQLAGHLPDANYVNTIQGGVMQKTWRRKVAEWLLEFVDEFGLPNDIVAVSINYMDMYLSRRQVDKINLQLLAMVCIFVASKFHEVEPISILELQTLAEGGYTESSIRTLELDLLTTLEWNMNPITTHHIMRHVANYLPAEIRWSLLEHSEGFCDYALTDYSLIACKKINVATASVLCGLANIGRTAIDETWLTQELMHHIGVGRTKQDRKEITVIRKKLTAVFYKNFPHLRPRASQEQPQRDEQVVVKHGRSEEQQLHATAQRTVSPTGVDSFPGSRSNSPVHYNNSVNKSFKQQRTLQQQQGKSGGGGGSPIPQQFSSSTVGTAGSSVVQDIHYPTKVTMVVGPTSKMGPSLTNGFQAPGHAFAGGHAFGIH